MDADCVLEESPSCSLLPLASSEVSVEDHAVLGPAELLKPASSSSRMGAQGLFESFESDSKTSEASDLFASMSQ